MTFSTPKTLLEAIIVLIIKKRAKIRPFDIFFIDTLLTDISLIIILNHHLFYSMLNYYINVTQKSPKFLLKWS